MGDGADAELLSFLDTVALPDPEDILSNPRSLQLPRRGDLAVGLAKSVLARVESDCTSDRWEPLRDVFEVTYVQNKEVAMAGYGRVWKLKPAQYDPPARNGVFTEMDLLRCGNS